MDAKPKAKKLPEFKAQKTYQLISAEAVLVAGQKASPDEIKQETENLQKKLIVRNTELQIENNNIRLFTQGGRDLRAIETNSTITYLMKSEDENGIFAYRLAFQLLNPKP